MDYGAMFKAVVADIAAKKKELSAAMARIEELEDDIAGLQQTAAGLAKTMRQPFVPDESTGLTEAMRRVFRTNAKRNFVATEIRDALAQMGYDISRHGNVLASIH